MGAGLSFTAAGDRVETPQVLPTGSTAPFRIIQRFRSRTTHRMIIWDRKPSGTGNRLYIDLNRGAATDVPNEIRVQSGVTSAGTTLVGQPGIAGININDGNWHVLEIRRASDGVTGTILVDGINITSSGGFASGNIGGTAGHVIGASGANNVNAFTNDLDIDYVHVYDAETGGAPLARWDFDEFGGSTAGDGGGADKHGTVVGADWISVPVYYVAGTVIVGTEYASRVVVVVDPVAGRVLGKAVSDPADGTYSITLNISQPVPIIGFICPDYGPTWRATVSVAIGARCVTNGNNQHWYECESAGTTAGTEPTWPTDGSTVSDGTVVWRDKGLMERPWAEGPYVPLAA